MNPGEMIEQLRAWAKDLRKVRNCATEEGRAKLRGVAAGLDAVADDLEREES